MNSAHLFPFDNSYARLPDYFFASLSPQPVGSPELIRLNQGLAQELGLDTEQLTSPTGVAALSGNEVPDGAEPLAMAYTGHQFGHFNPQLGDGRAILLGEILNPDGMRFDVQLKGSGRTPFSRGGDGRAALGPVLREYILCEFMQAVGIPTTRALAAVTTGEQVVRDRLLPGAILTRLSQSYVRVGTFQYFAARGNVQALQELTDYVINRNFPELLNADKPWLALLEAVIQRQARLIAQWMHIGFIHGVMNTDNMSIAGETIDYGPCAFMDSYHPNTVYSSIDHMGRYAYQNQPSIAHWNLCRFAETLIPLGGDEAEAVGEVVQEVINTFPDLYRAAWVDGIRSKLGLELAQEGDRDLADSLLEIMAEQGTDFTLSFRYLAALPKETSDADQPFLALFKDAEVITGWLQQWRERLSVESRSDAERQAVMEQINPLYIPRNHQIEAAIRAAEDHGEFKPFHDLVQVLEKPFQEQEGQEEYTLPPRAEQVVQQTFCGT